MLNMGGDANEYLLFSVVLSIYNAVSNIDANGSNEVKARRE